MNKYCRYCGTEQTEGNEFCPNCGARVNGEESSGEEFEILTSLEQSIGKRSPALAVLSFIFPLLGFILWAVFKDKQIGKSESCARGALTALAVLEPVFGIIYFFVMRRHRPDFAKSCLTGAIVSISLLVFLYIAFWVVLIGVAIFEGGGGAVDDAGSIMMAFRSFF